MSAQSLAEGAEIFALGLLPMFPNLVQPRQLNP